VTHLGFWLLSLFPVPSNCHLERSRPSRLRVGRRSRKACPEPVEGTWCLPAQPTPAQQYVHDFGSILNFTEWALGQGGVPLGWSQQTQWQGINPSYWYADYLAPDAPYTCKTLCPQPWSLADFFTDDTWQNKRPFFTQILGANYPTSWFLDPTQYFSPYPTDPDNDATDY